MKYCTYHFPNYNIYKIPRKLGKKLNIYIKSLKLYIKRVKIS